MQGRREKPLTAVPTSSTTGLTSREMQGRSSELLSLPLTSANRQGDETAASAKVK
jgi:hypothetical protein